MRKFLSLLLLVCFQLAAHSQTKTTSYFQQVWLGYYNQTKLSKNWELNADLHLRSKEDFINNLYQSIIRVGVSYYVSNAIKGTTGYAYVNYFPGDNHKNISQRENRYWQQFQWQMKFSKSLLQQKIRLEERYRHKILNDSTLANGYDFNWRLRYNVLFETPVLKKIKNRFYFVLNEEVNINFGKQIIYNYFDQNRFFAGFKYHIDAHNNIQFGYMNVFQQLGSGNKYKVTDVIRIFYFQNFDLSRNKKI
ncbi:MAG: DUF2490 domain-containing protein [Ferruginibacter sp.]